MKMNIKDSEYKKKMKSNKENRNKKDSINTG